MSLFDDVENYEDWLRKQCDVVEKGLCEKHDRMAENAFMFFRATCFRFARQWENCCRNWEMRRGHPAWAMPTSRIGVPGGMPRVGLVWGVNDFDEAADLPYTYDLLRLATQHTPGARICRGRKGSGPPRLSRDIARAWTRQNPVLSMTKCPGCRHSSTVRRQSQVLSRMSWTKSSPRSRHPRSPTHYVRGCPPARLKSALELGSGEVARLAGRATLPSASWQCGPAVREAKALVPSAWDWASGSESPDGQCLSSATGRYRSSDPFMEVRSGFIIRRIAPDSAKIDLAAEYARAFGPKLLAAMGADLASIHLAGNVDADRIARDLDRRDAGWLHAAARDRREGRAAGFPEMADLLTRAGRRRARNRNSRSPISANSPSRCKRL